MKKSDIEKFKSLLNPEPCSIVRRLRDAGYEAYIVGGAIRDLLLGEVPKDYDITTSATPEQVRSVFGRRHCIVIGRRFRLALLNFGGTQYEVSTFRKAPTTTQDSEGAEMIRDDNNFGTLEDDAFRRDFTVNAIYFDPVGDRGFIDLTGGLTDIKKKVVRCIGDPVVRFTEDPVRMLRAIKLCGQYGFKLGLPIKRAIKKLGENIHLASPARLFEELLKILVSPKSTMILTALQENGFLKYFWGTLSQSWEEEGIWFRQIMDRRCESLRNDEGYPHSKGLALATACFAFQMSAMSRGEGPRLWERSADVNMVTSKVIQLVFDGFSMPKIFAQRIGTIMNLVPRLTRRPVSQKALRNVEYFNALALADTLADVFQWERDGLDMLHQPNFTPPKLLPLKPVRTENAGQDDKSQAAPSEAAPAKRRRRRSRHKKANIVNEGDK